MLDQNAECKYVFVDIEGFSNERTIEAQTAIIAALNAIVRRTLSRYDLPRGQYILLPTGDGLCLALLNMTTPYDIHLRIALDMLKAVVEHNRMEKSPMRQFKIRIGLNENNDTLIVDINRRPNVAGAGINNAQRIMNTGDGGNVMVGNTVFEKLNQRERYYSSFKRFTTIIKHGETLQVHQYINPRLAYLNSDIPISFRKMKDDRTEKLSLELICYIYVITKYQKEIATLNKDALAMRTLRIALGFISGMYVKAYENRTDVLKRTILDPAKCFDESTMLADIPKAYEYYYKIDFTVQQVLESYFEERLFRKSGFEHLFEPSSYSLKISKKVQSGLGKEYSSVIRTFEVPKQDEPFAKHV